MPLIEASRTPMKVALCPSKKSASAYTSGFQNPLYRRTLIDLEAILDYISADDTEAAARFGNALLDHIELLAAFPHIGTSVKKKQRIRKLLHTHLLPHSRREADRRNSSFLARGSTKTEF
jgi:plasmid stabilization system protein ParE